MLRTLLMVLVSTAVAVSQTPNPRTILHQERSSSGDLEVGGAIAGVPAGATRYVRYEDLLRLPQKTYTVTDDTNFKGSTEVEGIPLAELSGIFGEKADMIVAICYDKYRTNYPPEYLNAHHPLLVLRVNGKERDGWPASEYDGSMGPFLISHPFFKPSFKVLSHEDEPQIPFGVTRIEFHRVSEVFGAIQPRGDWPADSAVGQGYVIARQDCFRCHNMGMHGGTMAGHSWRELASIADADGARFQRIIHDPKAVNPDAKMPAHGDYDQATLDALKAYFKTFSKSPVGIHPRRVRTP